MSTSHIKWRLTKWWKPMRQKIAIINQWKPYCQATQEVRRRKCTKDAQCINRTNELIKYHMDRACDRPYLAFPQEFEIQYTIKQKRWSSGLSVCPSKVRGENSRPTGHFCGRRQTVITLLVNTSDLMRCVILCHSIFHDHGSRLPTSPPPRLMSPSGHGACFSITPMLQVCRRKVSQWITFLLHKCTDTHKRTAPTFRRVQIVPSSANSLFESGPLPELPYHKKTEPIISPLTTTSAYSGLTIASGQEDNKFR